MNILLTKKQISLIAVLIPIFLSFYMLYLSHINYPYLFHVDEWHHLTYSQKIIETSEFVVNNPYFATHSPTFDLSFGYHYFLANFIILANLNPIFFMLFIPYLIYTIFILSIFNISKEISGSIACGFFSCMLALLIKSNVTLLGLFYAVPVALGISLAILSLFLIIKYEKNLSSNYLIIFIFITIFGIITHAPYGMIVALTIFLYFIISRINKIKTPLFENKKYIFLILFFMFLMGFFILKISIFWQGISIETILNLINWLSFGAEEDPNGLILIFGLFNYLGPIFIICFLIGFYFIIQDNKLLFVIWTLLLLFIIVLFAQFYVTIFIPYRRAILYFSSVAAVVGGFGAFKLLNLIQDTFKNNQIAIIYSILFFLVIISHMPASIGSATFIYRCLDQNDYEALILAKKILPTGSIILAKPTLSNAITPLTNFKVCAITDGQLWNYNPEFYFNASHLEFGDCNLISQTSASCNADYVFVHKQIECEKFDLVQKNGGAFIYKFKN